MGFNIVGLTLTLGCFLDLSLFKSRFIEFIEFIGAIGKRPDSCSPRSTKAFVPIQTKFLKDTYAPTIACVVELHW